MRREEVIRFGLCEKIRDWSKEYFVGLDAVTKTMIILQSGQPLPLQELEPGPY
jgi:hypothetical protein